MSLTSNARDVAFTTEWPSDKIVGVYEGSFNIATDVTTITADLGSIYVYRIPHGFSRPVFCDLLWKTTGSWNDAGDGSIAYSDATYIYIVGAVFVPGAGTMQYKVIATWIDSYDNTNPLVPSFISSTKSKLFDTSDNYQKIYDQNVLSFGSSSTQIVSHSLGYRPNFRVFYEALPGQVWPMFAGGVANPYLYNSAMVEAHGRMKTTGLEVELDSVTVPTRAWYKVYLDA
jgi:hypothetical protein